jgi:hypothetical protein
MSHLCVIHSVDYFYSIIRNEDVSPLASLQVNAKRETTRPYLLDELQKKICKIELEEKVY